MATVLRRLLRIIQSYHNAGTGKIGTENQKGGFDRNRGGDSFEYSRTHSGKKEPPQDSGYPERILEDLANFNLTPPSSFAEVKKARKRESKKYHPDRFANDPDKQATAQKIMQIYNASYERLKAFFRDSPR